MDWNLCKLSALEFLIRQVKAAIGKKASLMVEMTTACEAHECFVRFTSILNKAEARFHCMHYRSQGLHGEPKVSVELNDKLGLNYVLFYQQVFLFKISYGFT